jgi:ribonuclease HI
MTTTNLKHVDLYSDGSSRGNPGPGGFGTFLRFFDTHGQAHELKLSEGFEQTTNNRMELLGVIKGLEALKYPCEVRVVTDSQYVVNAFKQNWISGWQRNGWKNSKREPVKNDDLWKRLLRAMGNHKVDFEWVRGHAGHPENEECDRLATEAADGANLAKDTGYLKSLQ